MEIFVISTGIHAERRPHALNSDATASRLGAKRLGNNEGWEETSAVCEKINGKVGSEIEFFRDRKSRSKIFEIHKFSNFYC